MKLKFLLAVLFLGANFVSYAQTPVSIVGSGCALAFDGNDDYIEMPSSADFAPGSGALTVSLWVKFPDQFDGGQERILVWDAFATTWSFDYDARYKFVLTSTSLKWGVKDDAGEFHNVTMSYSSYNSPFDGRWHFLSGVIDIPNNETKMYFDGVLIGTNSSSPPMSSMTAVGADVPLEIGRELSNSFSVHHFDGEIDEIRIWNYARSADQIRLDMCRSVLGNEPGLVALWNFNQCQGEVLIDLTGNGHNGTLFNAPTWITSGAPLGNVSTYLYPSNWDNAEVSLVIDSQDSLVINQVTNNPEGMYLYGVQLPPNSLDTIDMISGNNRYFGVFSSHLTNGTTTAEYQVNYYYQNQPFVTSETIQNSLGLYSREENDSTLWSALPGVNNIFQQRVYQNNESYRSEYILGLVGVGCTLDLGEDQTVCQPDSVHLLPTENWLYTNWSTQETTYDIYATTTDDYILLATDTLGCTARDTVHVTVNPAYDIVNEISFCNGDSAFVAGQYQTSAGQYIEELTTIHGCDSIITTNIEVLMPSFNSFSVTVCDSYMSPAGNLYSTSGVYEDILVNAQGCDSIISIDLTVLHSTFSSQAVVACDSYTSPSGNYVWTESGSYTDTLINAVGCDSIITTILVLNHSTYSSINETACDEYVSPSGDNVWTTSGTYQDVIPNSAGCDSIITINLEIIITPSPVILTDEFACVRDNEFLLTAETPGGTWSGTGIVDDEQGIFDPSAVGVGSYSITYALGGFCPASTSYILEVKDCEALWQHIYVPNIFSPNGDDSNDVFYVYGDRIAEMELVLFDRWGEKVFSTTDKDVGWDGTYRGEPVDPAVFAFQLSGKYISGKTFKKSGYITLIR